VQREKKRNDESQFSRNTSQNINFEISSSRSREAFHVAQRAAARCHPVHVEFEVVPYCPSHMNNNMNTLLRNSY
jgi:hypothetical protein